MKKILFVTGFLFLLLCASNKYSKTAFAATCSVNPQVINVSTDPITLTITTDENLNNISRVQIYCNEFFDLTPPITKNTDGTMTISFHNYTVQGLNKCLYENGTGFGIRSPATLHVVNNSNNVICQHDFTQIVNVFNSAPNCSLLPNPNPVRSGQSYDIVVSNLPVGPNTEKLYLRRNYQGQPHLGDSTYDLNPQGASTQTISGFGPDNTNAKIDFYVEGTVNGTTAVYDKNPICRNTVTIDQGVSQVPGSGSTGVVIPSKICDFAGAKIDICRQCVNGQAPGTGGQPGIWTAFGCIPANPQDFIAELLQIAIGIGGGIAFLMIVYGGFVIMMSQSNPEKLNNGKEIIQSAVVGLLLIIFSVVILRIIGVDILQLPDLN